MENINQEIKNKLWKLEHELFTSLDTNTRNIVFYLWANQIGNRTISAIYYQYLLTQQDKVGIAFIKKKQQQDNV